MRGLEWEEAPAIGFYNSIAPINANMSNIAFEKLTSPFLKNNLTIASLYLTGYELLKNSIVEQIENFFIEPYSDKKDQLKLIKEYQNEVLSLHENKLIASCLWFKKMKAITDKDIEDIKKIREHRNVIAHELPKLLINKDDNINLEYLVKMRKLLKTVDTWWIKEVELSINPDFKGKNIEKLSVSSGPMMVLDYIISIALSEQEIFKSN